MSITETLKAKLDELDLDRRVDEVVAQAQTAWTQIQDKAGDLAHEHGDQVEKFLARISSEIDTRTDGKHAEQVGRVREQVVTGVAKLAERHESGAHALDPGSTDPKHACDDPS